MRLALALVSLLAVSAAPDGCGSSQPQEELRHPDCVGKSCGDACNPCGPERACPTLVPSACDRFGRCAGETPWLCHDPCAGKACGEDCRLCPPGATDCAETMEIKACDANGACVSRTPELACP